MNSKLEAKALSEETLNGDANIDAARLGAVCDYICDSKYSPERKIRILRGIRKLLKPVALGQSALIECSGPLKGETIQKLEKFVEDATGRRGIKFEIRENPELLGGVRIKCGDLIWERSAALDLTQLR